MRARVGVGGDEVSVVGRALYVLRRGAPHLICYDRQLLLGDKAANLGLIASVVGGQTLHHFFALLGRYSSK